MDVCRDAPAWAQRADPWRMAVLSPFRAPALGRHVHRELLRSVVLDVTPIRAATACHQRNYVVRYSRSTLIAPKPSAVGKALTVCVKPSCGRPVSPMRTRNMSHRILTSWQGGTGRSAWRPMVPCDADGEAGRAAHSQRARHSQRGCPRLVVLGCARLVAPIPWDAARSSSRAARDVLGVTIPAEGSPGVCARSPRLCNLYYITVCPSVNPY